VTVTAKPVSNSAMHDKVVQLAYDAYNQWTNGDHNISHYTTSDYTSGAAWCAEFVNWIFDKAGMSIPAVPDPTKPDHPTTKTWAPAFQYLTGQGGFTFHSFAEVNAETYTPQVGDIEVRESHVHIVVKVNSDGTLLTIGGNEGESTPLNNSIKETVWSKNYPGNNIVGYVTY